jgi:predicted membrane-bound mannosyltransferase
MTDTIINEKYFKEYLGAELNEAMTKAAEPMIQEALKKIEAKMRSTLAERLVSRIQSDYDIRYRGEILEIRIRQADHREFVNKI